MQRSLLFLRIPQLNVCKDKIYNKQTNILVDRTYFLGNNVKYIEYQKTNRGKLSIMYNDNTIEELYDTDNMISIKYTYDLILKNLKENNDIIEHPDSVI